MTPSYVVPVILATLVALALALPAWNAAHHRIRARNDRRPFAPRTARALTRLGLLLLAPLAGCSSSMPDPTVDAGDLCAPGYTAACNIEPHDAGRSYPVMCVDLQTDSENCGGCGIRCPLDNGFPAACAAGSCAPLHCQSRTCNTDQIPYCGTITDNCGGTLNCGMCGPGEVCGAAQENVCGAPGCAKDGDACGGKGGTCCAGLTCDGTAGCNGTGCCVCGSGAPNDAGLCP